MPTWKQINENGGTWIQDGMGDAGGPAMTFRRSIFVVAISTLLSVGGAGCSSDDSNDEGASTKGTAPSDGAPGVCCPASANRDSGCLFKGGYSASGECPERASLCDNLGPYSLGTDEHGCKGWSVGGS